MNKVTSLARILSRLGLKKEASVVTTLSWISRSPYFSQIGLNNFLSQNSDELDKIDRLSEGRFFFSKSGAEGTAYFIGDDHGAPKYVLKIDFLGSSHKLFEDSQWEAKVIDSGILNVKYDSGEDKKLTWKVIEKLSTDGIEGSGIQDIIDITLQSIEDLYREALKSKETSDLKRESISLMRVDVLDSDVISEVLSYCDANSIDLILDLKSKVLKEIGSTSEIESAIPQLKVGWLEDFILSIVRLLSEGKNDFGQDNVGVRESTGRLIWFDV
jgi:hypothetical protein